MPETPPNLCENGPPRQVETTADGWQYDLETGEILGRIEGDAHWNIDSAEAVDRALGLLAATEAEIVAIDARLKAITCNLRALRAEKERRLNWWDWRFHSQVVAFARSSLTGKSKTARFAHGTVSFRATKGTTTVIDDAAALEFVDTWSPESVTVKRYVSLAAVRAAIEAARSTIGDEPLPFLVVGEPGENVSIKTGVATEGGSK